MTAINPKTKQGLLLLAAAIITTLVVGAIGYRYPGTGYDPIVGALIWTGRLAFLVFLVPLFARPLRTLVKTPFTALLMRWRRNAGILYGGIQSVHLIIVCAMFLMLANPPTETIMVIVGSAGLALSLAMLITSFSGPTRALGPKRWKGLHKSGFHVFMFIYFFDFVVEPILLGHPTSHLFWAVLTVSGMALRTRVMFQQFSMGQRPAGRRHQGQTGGIGH